MKLQYSVQVYTDSLYLLQSNRLRCQELLNKDRLDENDFIDIYISMHIVLEVSLNALHRQLITSRIVKPINRMEVIENVDRIGFIEKTILFIYNANFNFSTGYEESAIHHRIIGKLRTFSGIRNKLLHGHSIASLMVDEQTTRISSARSNLTFDKLKVQIKLFIEIYDGMKFFINHLELEGMDQGFKEDLITQYLTYDFIPEKYLS